MGIYTHALLIGLGITAVIVSSPAVYDFLRLAGTVYLLWLGFMLIRSSLSAKPNHSSNGMTTVTLKDAWLANLLNPKDIIFYLTVVSQFSGKHGDVGNYLALASIHVVVFPVPEAPRPHSLAAAGREVLLPIETPYQFFVK